MWRLAAVIVMVLLLSAKTLNGQDASGFSIQIIIRSYHFDQTKDYNEWNLGIGFGYRIGPFFHETGIYHNSESKVSLYSTITKIYPAEGVRGVLASFGFVTGYDRARVSPLPVVGLYLNDNPRLRLGLIPNPTGASALFSQLNYYLP